MSFRPFLRPGQGFKKFKVYRRDGGTTSSGRAQTARLVEKGMIIGFLTQASPSEVAQWKQSGHPVTHTVVQRGINGRAEETDVLELVGSDGEKTRKFLVQTVQNPGDLNHFLVYKVEERKDL